MIGIGVIGVGRIGRMHAGLLAREVPGAALVAVHDADREAAESIGVRACELDELLADPGVDAVAICSSTETHADLIVAAAEAGKPIFCEKPISLDLAEVDRALAAVDAAGVPFQIGFNRRFDPAHQAVHEAWTDDLWARIRPEGNGVYVNFLQNEGPERIKDAYPAETLQRLREVKTKYDPANMFRFNQNIQPL